MKPYEQALCICKDLFLNKFKDYHDAWKILRKSSVLDQLYIKISRIRTIEETNINKVGEPIINEYIALVNYSVIALILNEEKLAYNLSIKDAENLYDKYTNMALSLLKNKNHDYDNIWQEIELTSITDIILMKILRSKNIVKNNEKLIVSEGLQANYLDIINYAIFYIIRVKNL